MSQTIGLVGCGNWGRNILRDLVTLGARVHVVVPSQASRDRAKALGAAGVWADIGALPQPIDGFVVAVPTHLHARIIEALLPTGKPIFVEKPITSRPADARRLVAAAGARLFVMDKWRYHPGVEALARLARAGELGRVRAVRSCRLGWGNPHGDSIASWHLMPHDLAIAYEILGRLPAVESAVALLPDRFGGDMLATFCDGPDDVRVMVEVGTAHPVNRRSVVVVGTDKTAQLADSYDECIFVRTGNPASPAVPGSQSERRAVGNAMPLYSELAAFLGFLRGGPPPRSSAAEGLLIVERIAAARALAGLSEADG
jgi:predicted dehydrogenase